MEEKGLRHKLWIVGGLIFALPFAIVLYVIYSSRVDLSVSHQIILVLTLVLILGGMIILRQLFDRISFIASLMKRAQTRSVSEINIKEETSELRDISKAFNDLIQDFRQTSLELAEVNGQLQHQIGEKEKLRQQLENKNKFLSNILDSSASISIISTDFDGNILFWNKGAENIFGYSAAEMVGNRKIEALYPEESEPLIREARARVLENKREAKIEVREFTKAGAEVWVNINLSPRVDQEGRVIGILGIGEDITERKEAEIALQCSEEKFRCLSENAPDIVFTLGMEGNITYLNPAFEKLLGYKREEAREEIFTKFCRAEDAHLFAEAIKKAGDSGETISNEHLILIHKDGSRRFFNVSAAPNVDGAGEVTGMVGLCKDISEKENLTRQLQHAQKMEAIGTLAGGIAHDFNNILTAILGHTELAAKKISGDDGPKSNLEEIKKAGLRAKSLVEQIVTFGRRRERAEHVPIQMGPILKETIKFLRATLPANININQDIPRDNARLMADPTHIHQILMNLCTNAAHAMRPEGGLLTVSLATAEKLPANVGPLDQELPPGPYLKLNVSDTGCGMSRELRERIFEPYFTTKPKDEGTGLGLSTVHGIIKSLGGAIEVQSRPQKGTTFTIYFPGTKVSKLEGNKREVEALPAGSERILLVDDEMVLAEMGKETLETLGYEVHITPSPVEALEIFQAAPEHYDLVITDMNMPRMNGESLAQQLLRVRANIPIIVASGDSREFTAEKAAALGIRRYLKKPYLMSDLANTMREVLEEPQGKS